ncbi:Clp protease N-terminal domain-containing protein [Streptomyces uncialis]|uniref:Clp protease N-terminal domain-containing protein n=1 Tax=Streptomyces uncialis TaxID=1048205 RepID=UPI0033F703EC
MTSDKEADPMDTVTARAHWRVAGVMGAAWGAVPDGGDIIATEHLLAGIAGTRSDAAKALSVAGATVTAQLAVLRDHHDGAAAWDSTDDTDTSVPSVDLLGDDGDKGRRLSGAAARALTHAMDQARSARSDHYTTEHLLRGLLADGTSRAARMLTLCGTDAAEVLRRLDEGDFEPADDGLRPQLWPTRDTLLGRRSPTGTSLWRRLLLRLAKGANLAASPVSWLGFDAVQQAAGLKQRLGTEHLLLSVLATHEVAVRYPHLATAAAPADGDGPDVADRFAGGAALHALGVDYLTVRRAVERDGHQLGEDDRDPDTYLEAFEGGDGTGPLTQSLLQGENRARRLLITLGFPV